MKTLFLKSTLKSFLLVIIVIMIIPATAYSQVLLSQITSQGELIGGPNAEGQIGDYLFRSDNIAIIVSDIDHPWYYTNTGGNIVDADIADGSGDLLNCFFTYFDNTFPNQGNYTSAEIVNDGSNGEPAILRVSGFYSENDQVDVTTEYSFTESDYFITIQTWLVNNSDLPINDFGLGDAIQWGDTYHFAPGYGFELWDIVTTTEWLAGSGDGVSYGCTPPSGTITGPNGGGWSDPVVANV
ncbi:MAG: hypothetical protein GY855_06860, partial [candidate division Zixibacteria bacterium]|nr:hypothetical protein [candidate division Zixibacteria bacterium]